MKLFGKKKERTEHQYVEERLSAYLDGQLSAKERAVVDRHLKTCAHCRWNLDTLKQTVLLTRSLPTVPVPRVFTIPVPAQGTRAHQRAPLRRPWGLPVLQGATVLVAVMFFLAVASEFALTGLLPSSVPEPVALLEQAPQATQISDRVAEVKEEAAVTEVVAEAAEEPAVSAVAEAEVGTESLAPEPSIGPVPELVATEEVQAEEETLVVEAEPVEETVTASPEPNVGAMGGVQFPSPGEAEDDAERSTAEEAPPASVGMATSTALAPSPTVAPSPTATLMPTLAPAFTATAADVTEPDASWPEGSGLEEPGDEAPTVVAEVQAPVPAGPEQESAQPAGAFRESVIGWLGAAETALAIVFLVLGIATVVVMYRYRRAH